MQLCVSKLLPFSAGTKSTHTVVKTNLPETHMSHTTEERRGILEFYWNDINRKALQPL